MVKMAYTLREVVLERLREAGDSPENIARLRKELDYYSEFSNEMFDEAVQLLAWEQEGVVWAGEALAEAIRQQELILVGVKSSPLYAEIKRLEKEIEQLTQQLEPLERDSQQASIRKKLLEELDAQAKGTTNARIPLTARIGNVVELPLTWSGAWLLEDRHPIRLSKLGQYDAYGDSKEFGRCNIIYGENQDYAMPCNPKVTDIAKLGRFYDAEKTQLIHQGTINVGSAGIAREYRSE